MRIVLGSASPRRRDLLEGLGLHVEVVAADIDESVRPDEEAAPYVARLAAEKAAAVATRLGAARDDDLLIIAADTTVDLGGRILGKPEDEAEARGMLAALSSRTHRVHTGVTVHRGGRSLTDIATTEVTFAALSPSIVDWYIGTGEPYGKAGAYAIQGAGSVLVASVHGSVSNVVGLPLITVVELCRSLGFELLR
jgi:septum formation protein